MTQNRSQGAKHLMMCDRILGHYPKCPACRLDAKYKNVLNNQNNSPDNCLPPTYKKTNILDLELALALSENKVVDLVNTIEKIMNMGLYGHNAVKQVILFNQIIARVKTK